MEEPTPEDMMMKLLESGDIKLNEYLAWLTHTDKSYKSLKDFVKPTNSKKQ